MRNLRRVSVSMALTAIGLVGATTVLGQTSSKGEVLVLPDNVKYVDIPGLLPGAQIAVLMGDPKKPGPYVMRVKFPPNTMNAPHTHPDNRQGTVLSGSWNFGHGDKIDIGNSTKLPAGTFFTESAGSTHYTFSSTEMVIVQISGTGPTSTDYLK